MKEQKGCGLKLAALSKQWDELGIEGQKKYVEQAEMSAKAYAADIEMWGKSKEGKKHAREIESQKQKKKEVKAREKFLSGENAPVAPQKPKSAQAMFIEEKKGELQRTEPNIGVRESGRKALTLWAELDIEARKAYENKHKALSDAYEFELQTYKETPAYKKFEKACGLRDGKKVKSGRGRGGGRGGGRGAKRRKKGDGVDGLCNEDSDMGLDSEDELAEILGLDSDDDYA